MEENSQKILKRIEKIEGYLVPGQEKILYKIASSLKFNSTIVEIGSFMGKSTACLAAGSPQTTTIYAIDTFKGNEKDFLPGVQFEGGNFYQNFKKNIENLGLFFKIKPLKGFSQRFGEKWDKTIDLLFIDGSHAYEDVKKDFELFFPWVKPGGIIAFHDVTPKFPGVYRVWNEIAKKKLSAYGNFRTLYFGFKPHPLLSKTVDKQKILSILEEKLTKVFVITPVHNRLQYTKKCLDSLKRQSYKKFETILIDDGSTDKTSEHVKKNYPDVIIIRGTGNWWWTKSVYKGAEEALKKAQKGDFILTMNNDCYFKKDYLKNIVRASQDNGRVIVGSLILDAKNPQRVRDAGVKIVWEKSLIYAVAEKISRHIKYYSDREIIRNIDTLPGKGTLIPIEVFKKIGNFNYHRLPHYIGDYEFFCRAKRRGFKLIVSSKSRLYNFTKQTGSSHISKHSASYKEILGLFFGRKSKLNLTDHINFLLLCCPKKYLLRNFKNVLSKIINYGLMLFPFYYIKIFLDIFRKLKYRTRILLHNIPIYIRQNQTLKKLKRLSH